MDRRRDEEESWPRNSGPELEVGADSTADWSSSSPDYPCTIDTIYRSRVGFPVLENSPIEVLVKQ